MIQKTRPLGPRPPFSGWPLAPHATFQAASAAVAMTGLAALFHQWTTLRVLHRLYVSLFLLLFADSTWLLIHLVLDIAARRWRRSMATLGLMVMGVLLAAGYGTFALALML